MVKITIVDLVNEATQLADLPDLLNKEKKNDPKFNEFFSGFLNVIKDLNNILGKIKILEKNKPELEKLWGKVRSSVTDMNFSTCSGFSVTESHNQYSTGCSNNSTANDNFNKLYHEILDPFRSHLDAKIKNLKNFLGQIDGYSDVFKKWLRKKEIKNAKKEFATVVKGFLKGKAIPFLEKMVSSGGMSNFPTQELEIDV